MVVEFLVQPQGRLVPSHFVGNAVQLGLGGNVGYRPHNNEVCGGKQ